MNQIPQKLRILFMESGEGKGGSSMFLYSLLHYLNRERFEPFVAFNFYNNGPDTDKIRSLGIPVLFLSNTEQNNTFLRFLPKSRWNLLNKIKVYLRFLLRLIVVRTPQLWNLLRILKKENIALIVLNNDVHYHVVGAMAAKITGIPCICRKAGGIGEGKSIKKLLTPWVDLFIAISKATAKDQLENNPATKRVETIYAGVDLKSVDSSSSHPELCRELSIPAGRKIVGYISRVEKGKGQSEFIEAAALIVREYKNVVFLIVGNGDMIDDLKAKVRDLNLDDYVIFTGWSMNTHEVLSILDILVHCPTTFIEGLGIANLEAMGMAKPTVVSNNGGLPDAVIDGVTGFVVPPGDIEKMSTAILRLLEDEPLALRLGRNGRQRIENEFDIKKISKKFEKVFDEYAH